MLDKKLLFKHMSWKVKSDSWNTTYPAPFFWKESLNFQDIQKWWEKTISLIHQNPFRKIGVYVHIPFCETKCLFCACITKVETKEKIYDEYLDFLEMEMKQMSPIFTWVFFDTIYVWGGTPTILSPNQLDRLFKMIKDNFDMSLMRQAMVESSPHTTTADKMAIMSKNGVNKLTFWVQSLDEHTLKLNNRVQKFEDVKNAIFLAKKNGIHNINLDVMVGITGQSPQSFQETLAQATQLGATSIQVNHFLPFRESNFTKAHKKYTLEDIENRNQMREFAESIWEKESELSDIQRSLQLNSFIFENASILWFWYSAFSHAFGSMFYEHQSMENFEKFSKAEDVLTRGYNIDISHEIIGHLLLNLREWVHFDLFEKIFWFSLYDNDTFRTKIKPLCDKRILIEHQTPKGKCLKINAESEFLLMYSMNFCYHEDLITDFLKYYLSHPHEFQDLELKIKQFFYD